MDGNDLLPGGHCLNWQRELVWGNIVTESLVTIAFLSIALNLLYIYRKRSDIDFRVMLVMFAISVITAGISNIMDILTIWYPHYVLEIIFLSISAISATITAVLLLRITPTALRLVSPWQWKNINDQLKQEIAERERIQMEKADIERQMIELERQEAVKALSQKEATFQLVTENVRDYAIYLLDKNGDVATWNKGAERLTGYKDDEIIGKNFALFFPVDLIHSGYPMTELKCAVESGQYLDEGWRIRKDGSRFLANTCITVLKDENGQVSGFLKIARDITLQRKISDELQESEEKFRGTFEQAAVGIGHVALDGRFIRINERFSEITGYPKAELEKLTFQAITHPQDIDADIEQLRQLTDGKISTYTMDKRYIRKQGNIIWVTLTVSLVRDSSGAAKYAISVVQDITRRKETEDKLQLLGKELKVLLDERTINLGEETAKRLATQDILERREAQLRLITGAIPAAVLYIDNQLIHRFCNLTYANWIQRPSSEIIGTCLKEIVGDEFYSNLYEHIVKVLQGNHVAIDMTFSYKDKPRFAHVDLVPDKDATGAVRGFIALIIDISANKAILTELENAKIAADAANQSKSAFLANMSHEIRTPLGAVLGFSELLGSDQVKPAEKKIYVSAIKRNGDLLATIINDILDLSKVEAGKFEIEINKVKLLEVLQDILYILNLQASEKGISLTITTEGAIPDVIWTDALRLRQVLINIVGNAIKFTERGAVEVKVKQLIADGKSRVAFYVKDTGCGLSSEQIPKLFTPFSQADVTTKRRFGGSGLGLVLSKKLANLLGGDVKLIESKIGAGSTFLITIDPGESEKIPVDSKGNASLPPEKDKTVDLNHRRIDSIRVLLVEDSLDNQLLLKTFLQKAGAAVEFANNGKEAVEKANTGTYDVVLMDIQMPVMDGYEATSILRKNGFAQPIIALSAHAMKEEQSRCLDNGFSDYLAKPVNRDTLISHIANQVAMSKNLDALKISLLN